MVSYVVADLRTRIARRVRPFREITRSVVDALKIKLAVALPAHKQPNTEGYDLYLKGRYFVNRKTEPDIKRAI